MNYCIILISFLNQALRWLSEMAEKDIRDDTYELDVSFPVHMNRVWMKKYHAADEHYHWHDFFEISYVCSGCATCFVDGASYPVQQGDIVVFNAGEIHGWGMKEDVELLVMTFSKEIVAGDPYIDDEILGFFGDLTSKFSNILNGRLDATEMIRHSLLFAWQEWNGHDVGRNSMIKAELLRVLTYLNRYFVNGGVDFDTIRKKRKELKRLDSVLRYLDDHYMEKISIGEVASVAGMTPNYFSKLFHRLMGQKYIDYIIQKRIYRANELLETTEKNVVDIAADCGFISTASFYRAYRKYYKKAPRQ